MIGNHSFFTDVFLLSLYACIFTALSYAAGVFVFNVQSGQPTRRAFFNVILGMLLLIDLYSCICTGFKTVNVFSLAVLAYIAKGNQQFFKIKNLDFKTLLPLLYIFPALFILYNMYTLQISVEDDTKYYSKIAFALKETGNENFYHFYNSYDAKFNGVVPYHYIELWLASFFKFTTGTLMIFSLKHFTYPFLISLFIFGFLATVQKYRLLFFAVVLALTLLPLATYLNIIETGWVVMSDFWLRPNFIPYYLLFILLYNAVLDNNNTLFYLVIALGLTFSIVIVPSIVLSLFLLAAYLFLTKKQTLKQSFRYMLPALFVLAGMLVMYRLFGAKINVTTDFSIKEMVLHNLKIWKAIVFASVILVAEGSLVVGIMFLYNKLVHKNEQVSRFIIFIFFLLLTGVLMFQALNQVDNSYQFAYFAYGGVGFVFIALIVKMLDTIKMQGIKIAAAVAVVFACLFLCVRGDFSTTALSSTLRETDLRNAHVSPEWAQHFESYLSGHPRAKGSFLYSSDLVMFMPKGRHCLTKQLGSYVSYFTDDCNLPSITCRDSVLHDMTEATKDAFKKPIGWLNAFPDYTNDCNPVNYLKSGQFDYFICHINVPIADSAVIVVADTLAKNKMIYLKNPVTVK